MTTTDLPAPPAGAADVDDHIGLQHVAIAARMIARAQISGAGENAPRVRVYEIRDDGVRHERHNLTVDGASDLATALIAAIADIETAGTHIEVVRRLSDETD